MNTRYLGCMNTEAGDTDRWVWRIGFGWVERPVEDETEQEQGEARAA